MKKISKHKKIKPQIIIKVAVICLICVFSTLGGLGAYHYVKADQETEPIYLELDPNLSLKQQVEEFFVANNATEMIDIIECESQFKHYEVDGSVLKNKAGSSATGIAQILASVHPDPKIIKRYNLVNETDLKISDFNIKTLEGNLGYALMLYQVNGVKDWECSKNFKFKS
jgi:hypothetical protein